MGAGSATLSGRSGNDQNSRSHHRRKRQVSLLEPVRPSSARRAIVTILEEAPVAEAALLSEAVLSQDSDRAREDAAWAHLQAVR